MLYIATPYTHKDPAVMEQRFERAIQYVHKFMILRIPCFSPIVHCHPVAIRFDMPKDWKFWGDHCLCALNTCNVLGVVMMDGWKDSLGVYKEIKHAQKMGITITYIPDDLPPLS